MHTPIVISEDQFRLLSQNELGPRIRIIREVLCSHFGEQYTSKNVALRIGNISPPALSAIERGETKDCPSKVLHALSRDFSVNMDIFFDDFYLRGYRTILIGGELDLESQQTIALSMPTLNPFQEKEYKCIISVDIEASNADRRSMYERRTRIKLTPDQYTVLTTDIENSITNLEMLLSQELIPSSISKSSFEKVKMQLDLRHNNPSYIGWVPKAVYDSLINKMLDLAESYTSQLLNDEDPTIKEAELLFANQNDSLIEKLSEPKKRRKPVQMPGLSK